MKPDGDVVITQSFTHRVLGRPYQAGDVVICQCPYDPSKTVCKRIVAMEGDIVDPYSNSRSYTHRKGWTQWKRADRNSGSGNYDEKMEIPPGHVWLRGDNSKNSRLALHVFALFVFVAYNMRFVEHVIRIVFFHFLEIHATTDLCLCSYSGAK